MKHLIYTAVAVSVLGLATGAFACGAQHTAALANGNIVVAQQDQNAPAMQNPQENQNNGATTDENKPDQQ